MIIFDMSIVQGRKVYRVFTHFSLPPCTVMPFIYSIFEKCNDLDHIPKGDTSFEVWVYLSNCEKQSEKRRNANMSEYLIDNGSMGRHIGVS